MVSFIDTVWKEKIGLAMRLPGAMYLRRFVRQDSNVRRIRRPKGHNINEAQRTDMCLFLLLTPALKS